MGKHVDPDFTPKAPSPHEWAQVKIPDRVAFSDEGIFSSFDDKEIVNIRSADSPHAHITGVVMGFARFPEHEEETFVLLQLQLEGEWVPLALVDTPENMKILAEGIIEAVNDLPASDAVFDAQPHPED
jgi:hypothetical protein